jgi:hypothetical protein
MITRNKVSVYSLFIKVLSASTQTVKRKDENYKYEIFFICKRRVEKSIAGQHLVKQVSAATNTHVRVKNLLSVNFNNRLVKICFHGNEYKQKSKCTDGWGGGGGFVFEPPHIFISRSKPDQGGSRVEAGSNTSTVPLRVVGGDDRI